MTTMNTNERDERLKQIRERLAKNELAPYAPDEWWADTHFLLSLLDSQAVDFNSHYEGLMRAALLREQNAATRMRDKCVETVKEMKAGYDSRWRTVAHPEKSGAITSQSWQHYSSAADEIITALESLTLDQGEQKETK